MKPGKRNRVQFLLEKGTERGKVRNPASATKKSDSIGLFSLLKSINDLSESINTSIAKV